MLNIPVTTAPQRSEPRKVKMIGYTRKFIMTETYCFLLLMKMIIA